MGSCSWEGAGCDPGRKERVGTGQRGRERAVMWRAGVAGTRRGARDMPSTLCGQREPNSGSPEWSCCSRVPEGWRAVKSNSDFLCGQREPTGRFIREPVTEQLSVPRALGQAQARVRHAPCSSCAFAPCCPLCLCPLLAPAQSSLLSHRPGPALAGAHAMET